MTETAYQAAQLAKLEAETRFLLAQAVREEQEAVLAGMNRAEREREEAMASSFTYRFDQDFNEESVGKLLDTIHGWHNLDDEADWHVYLNSPGGYVYEGFHAFDDLEAFSRRGGGTHHITMTVRGQASSMAGILLQVADERVIGPRAQILIHPMSSWFGGTRGENLDYAVWMEQATSQVFDIFRDRGRIPKKKLAEALERRDLWISADQALAWRLVDRIG